jgi:diguanylate cyclase (GGDEF)-like protein
MLDLNFYKRLVESFPFSLLVVDGEGRIVQSSNGDGVREFHGLDAGDFETTENYLELCETSDADSAREAHDGLKSVLSGNEDVFRMEYRATRAKEPRWYLMHAYPFAGDRGTYHLVLHVDITERRRSEREYRRLSSIVRRIPVCIMTLKHPWRRQTSGEGILPEEGRGSFVVTDFNPRAEDVTGISYKKVLGKQYDEVFAAVFGEKLKQELVKVVRKNENYEAKAVLSEDERFEGRRWNLDVFNVTDDFVAILFEDVTQEVKNRERLEFLATYDELTGISNRENLLETFRSEFNRARRYDNTLSFLLFDLDQFKEVNDTYGHVVGDTVLERVGNLLKEETRQSDCAGRYGGEEFGVVLVETPETEACNLAVRLKKQIEVLSLETESGNPFTITASIGVSGRKPKDTDIKDILRRTDEALYEAKNRGRNQVVCWTEAVEENSTLSE